MSPGALRVDQVSVAFGGLQALRDFSMQVEDGQTCALIGPNGAGKTTLLNAITGRVRPSQGSLWFAGRRIDGLPRHARAHLGIARTFQNLESLERSTVLDHLLLGTHRLGRAGLLAQLLNLPAARDEDRRAHAIAEEVMVRLGLQAHRHWAVADLPYGDRRLVELGRALATQPRLLLLDEPAAGLSEAQAEALAQCLVALRDSSGIAILLIEHDMRFVESVAQRVVVIDEGRPLTSGSAQAVRADPRVQQLYLGA